MLRIRNNNFNEFFSLKKAGDQLPKEGVTFLDGAINRWNSGYKCDSPPKWDVWQTEQGEDFAVGIKEMHPTGTIHPRSSAYNPMSMMYPPVAEVPTMVSGVLVREFPSCCGAVVLHGFSLASIQALDRHFLRIIGEWLAQSSYTFAHAILTAHQTASYKETLTALDFKLVHSRPSRRTGMGLDSYIFNF